MNKLIAKYEIHDTFSITGRGIVFAGFEKGLIIKSLEVKSFMLIQFTADIQQKKKIKRAPTISKAPLGNLRPAIHYDQNNKQIPAPISVVGRATIFLL